MPGLSPVRQAFPPSRGFRSQISRFTVHTENKHPKTVHQPNSRRRRATLTPDRASLCPRSLKFESCSSRVRQSPRRTQNQIAKRTQFDPLFSIKGQAESQIPPCGGGVSAPGALFDNFPPRRQKRHFQYLFKCVARRRAAANRGRRNQK